MHFCTAEIIRTMTSHKVRRLPVIEGHDLVSMVALADAARTLPAGAGHERWKDRRSKTVALERRLEHGCAGRRVNQALHFGYVLRS